MILKIFALFIFTLSYKIAGVRRELYKKSLRAKTLEDALSNHAKYAGEQREAKRGCTTAHHQNK